jgi:PAS domain S-box-containing protein
MILDQEKIARIKNLLKFKPKGMSISDISHSLRMNRNSVAKYLDLLLVSGQVDVQSYGTAKVFTLSHRVPLSAMLSFSSELVLILDTDLRIIQVNDNFLNAFDLRRDALIGYNIIDIPLAFIPDLPVKEVPGDAKGKKEVSKEIHYEREGVSSFYQAKLIPTVFEEGTNGLTIIFEDITGTKNYEHQLEESEERYRNIVEDQTEFISRFLPDGTHRFVNDAYLRYFQKTKDEIIDRVFAPEIPPEDLDGVRSHFKSLTPTNPVASIDHRIVMPDGQVRWQRWSDRAIFDGSGTVVEYQSVGRDITERKEAELRAAEYTHAMEVLSSYAVDFIELKESRDIYSLIGTGVLDLVPGAVVVVHSYNEKTGQFFTHTVKDEEDRSRIATIIGRDPVGIVYTISDRPRHNLMSRKLVRIETSLYDSMNQALSRDMCETIERDLRISGIYIVGLAWGEQLFGRVSILLKDTETLPGREILETFIRLSSIALQRGYAEQANHENEERFRNIAEFSPFPISIVDPSGTIVYLNKRFTEVFGYSTDELITIADWQKRAYPDPNVREMMESTRIGWLGSASVGQVMQIQATAISKDNVSKELMIRAVSMSGGGQFIVYEDITDRVSNEKMRALHTSIIDSSEDAIVAKTLDGVVISWNKGAEKMYGYRADEMIGGPITRIIPESMAKSVSLLLDGIRRGETFERVDTVRKRKDGSYIDVSLTMSPIRDEKGCIFGASTIARDVTARKIAQKDLLVKEYAIASSVNGIAIADLQGNLTYANKAFLRMFGYHSFDEMIGTAIEYFSHEDAIEADVIAKVKQSLQKKGWWTGVTSPKKKDGSSFDAHLTASLVNDSEGNPLCMMATFMDITGRKSIERELFLKETAASASVNGIAILDLAGNVIYANRVFAGMFGYRSQDDVIYHPIEYFAFGDESILEEIHRINCAARENGEWQGDLILKGRDGTTTCYDLTVRTISDYSDKILYAVLSFVDRTHIKSLVPGPGATDGEIGGIIEFLPDPTFVIDCDRRVTAWNRAMEEFSGIMRCNMIGTGDYPGISSLSGGAGPVLIDMLDMPEEEIRATYPDVIKLGSALIAGIRGTDSGAQGKTACLARASPIPDSGGTRRGAIMTIRDIGSLKMFGESLTRAHDRSRADIQDKLDKLSVEHRNLEQEYNHLIATHNEEAPLADAMNRTADLVVILDRTGKIINSNRATESTINGSSGGTVRGKHISLLIAPEYRKVVLDSLDEAQKNGHTKVRYFLVTCEGRVMVETTLSVLKEDADETSGYILIQRVQNTADRNVRLR